MKLTALKRLLLTTTITATVTAVAMTTMQLTGPPLPSAAAASAPGGASLADQKVTLVAAGTDAGADHGSAPARDVADHEHANVEDAEHTHDEGEAHEHAHDDGDPEQGETRMIEGRNGRSDVEVHELSAKQQATPTDTASLYRSAGLRQAAASKLAKAGGTANAAAAPAGATSVPTLAKHVAPSCNGTGADGNRVQVLYVREQGTVSRYSTVVALLRNEVANVDDAYAVSARKTGGGRRVRWVNDANCVPTIPEVVVPNGAFATANGALDAIKVQAGAETNRKYLAFADTSQVCGYAQVFGDESSTNNANNGGRAQYARVDVPCWNSGTHSTAGHELTHMLGAVQINAPHATLPGHCTDDADLMCYDDGTGQTRTNTCPEASAPLLDCGNDDYFTTAPLSGSYLATHWNTANSSFLDVVPVLPAAPVVTVTASDPAPGTGELITFTATSDQSGTFAWTTDSSCGIAGASTTGSTFQLRCPSGYTGQVSADVTVTTTDGAYTGVGTRSVLVHQSAAPRATVAVSANVRAGTPFTMTATPTGVAPFTYEWAIPAGCTKGSIVASQVAVTCPAPGGLTAQVRVTQADRQSIIASANVTVLKVETAVTAVITSKVVTGRLLTRAGAAVAGQPVTLQVRKATTPTWSNLTTVTTSSTGTLRRAVGPTVKTYYRWRYAATTSTYYAASTSNYVTFRP